MLYELVKIIHAKQALPFSMTTIYEIKEVNDFFLAGMLHHLWQIETFLGNEIVFKDGCNQVSSLSLFRGYSFHQG